MARFSPRGPPTCLKASQLLLNTTDARPADASGADPSAPSASRSVPDPALGAEVASRCALNTSLARWNIRARILAEGVLPKKLTSGCSCIVAWVVMQSCVWVCHLMDRIFTDQVQRKTWAHGDLPRSLAALALVNRLVGPRRQRSWATAWSSGSLMLPIAEAACPKMLSTSVGSLKLEAVPNREVSNLLISSTSIFLSASISLGRNGNAPRVTPI